MFSYGTYKLVHFFGLFFVFSALGGAAVANMNGIAKADNKGRKLIAMGHGLGLFLVLLGGFGMAARIGVVHGTFPLWFLLKLVIWLAFGAAIVPLLRKMGTGKALFLALPVLGLVAALVVQAKPGSESAPSEVEAVETEAATADEEAQPATGDEG